LNLQEKSNNVKVIDKDIKWINILFKIMWLVTLALFVAISFEIETGQKLCYWAFSILNLICFALTVAKKQNQEKVKGVKDTNFVLLCAVIVSTCISLGFVGTFRTNADNLMGYLGFIGIPFVMYYSDYIKIEKKDLKFIGVVNIFISILFIAVSTMGFAYGRDEKWTLSLTLGFSNPNLASMMIFINTMFLLITRKIFRSRMTRSLVTFLIVYSIYLIYLTQCRASLAAVLVLLVIVFFSSKYKIRPVMTVVSVVFPLLFMFILTYLYKNDYFKDIEILGKTLYSGRETYYSEVLSEITRYEFGPIFGLFREFQNTHNSALSLMRFFGIPSMIFYYIYVIKNILGLTKKRFDNKASYACYIAILALYVQSCAESAIILGGGVWIIAILSLFAIAGNYREENEEIINEDVRK